MPDELVDVVNEKDEVIGEAMRNQCHREGLWHRTVAVLVVNLAGDMLLQKRGPRMYHPNRFCESGSGHLPKGESYYDGALRELKEEVGIIPDKLTLIGKFQTDEPKVKEHNREHYELYTCTYDGEISPRPGEVTTAKFVPIAVIKALIEDQPYRFTPGFRIRFGQYIEWKNNSLENEE